MTRKTKWWLIGGGCGFLCVLTAGIVVFLALLFDPVKAYPVPKVSLNDLMLQAQLIGTVSKQVRTEQDSRLSITLTPEQVRSLLRMALNQHAFKLPEGQPFPLAASYHSDGRVEIDSMYDSGFHWLFGGGIRMQVTGRLGYRDGAFVFDTDFFQVGAFVLPDEVRQKAVAKIMARLNKEIIPLGELGLETVTCGDDGTVSVEIDTAKALSY